MQARNQFLALLLTLAMLIGAAGLTSAAFADDIPNITMELSDIDRQLAFIQSQAANLKQPDSDVTWFYTVTDLDHDGNLEFVAASQHPQNRSTNLRVWEVSTDRTALTECTLAKDPEESFPDILTDVADTFHDTANDTWYYLLYDNVILSDDEVYTVKTAVRLKDGVIDYGAFAIEHTVVANGLRSVSHTDTSGVSISAEQYNASGNDAFAGAVRSSTNFEWLGAADAGDLTKLTDSFAVFMGQKAPTEIFPVPKPAALNAPPADGGASATPVPAATPAPAQPVYLTITKNPTNENRTEGDTAYFVSAANAYESLAWTFVSPDGGEYSAATMQSMWGGVGGQSSTTLSISNVNTNMNGWGAYCTFYYQGQTARTSTAYMYISAKPQGAPAGNYGGYVTDWNYSTITLNIENKVTVQVPWSICDVEGDINYGASASIYWNGQSVTWCYIKGVTPNPQPIYGSMSGTCYRDTAATVYVVLSNGLGVHLNGYLVNIVSGSDIDGAPCVVYYTEYPSESTIYSIDVYGFDSYSDQGGWAGSNYPYGWDDNDYTYGDTFVYDLHDAYNPDGSTYNTVTCPNCGREVSMAYDDCPYCGFPLWN